jgi:hypothetical protein
MPALMGLVGLPHASPKKIKVIKKPILKPFIHSSSFVFI